MKSKKLDNHELRMAYAKAIATSNENQIAYHANLDIAVDMINFDYMDTTIYNPFVDTTGRFSVDPIEEYGDSF